MAVRIGKDLVAASATPLVLGILAENESWGYAILKRVNELSGGELAWTEGMLYPLLHRLERLGHVESTWRDSEAGRRRKHYRITAAGRVALADQLRQWSVITGAFAEIWDKARSGADLAGADLAGADPAPLSQPGELGQALRPLNSLSVGDRFLGWWPAFERGRGFSLATGEAGALK